MSTSRFALWWAGVYTRGLEGEARRARLREIESDIWEHGRSEGEGVRTGLSILSRCVRGVPADLVWRHAARARGDRRLPWGRLARALGWSAAACSYTLLVLVHTIGSTPFLGLDLIGGEADDVRRTARTALVLLVLLLAGLTLLLGRRRRRFGAALLVAGAMGTPVAYSWAVVLFGPVGVAASAGALSVLTRRR